AYIDLASRQELVALSEHNIKAHEKYLEMAKEKEAISGEILETYQVKSKYHSVLDSFYEQENEQTQALNLYEQLVGKELEGDICRPTVNKNFLPATIEEAVKEGLRRSYKLKEQIAKTKEQGAKITQERAGYKPTLKLQLQAELDNDIELEENGRQDTYSARLYLSWNLFQGGKTYYMTEKERIFLKEEQKKIDVITKEVTLEIKNAYNTFYNFEKRIKNIELYEEDNFNILKTYKKQLADGTRTFIDILNAEAELYRSSIEKIQQKFDYIGSYYELLFNMSMLSDVILMEDKQTCDRYNFIPKNSDVQDNGSNNTLSEDLLNMFDDAPVEDSVQINEDENRLKNLYNN
ncbi:MAG: TolC family protein, partial [Arcobacteraceae bacterium]